VSFAATLCFGVAVWPAYLKAGAAARELMIEGRFKSEAMVTVFASLKLLGVDGTLALLAQAACAVAVLGMLVYGVVGRWEARRIYGMAALTTLCVSPYAFVYDFPTLGVATALLAAPLAAACGVVKRLVLFTLIWLATGGLLFNALFLHISAQGWLKFSGFLFLLAVVLIFDALRKTSEA
jgi:hypothetical protein